MHQAPRAHYLAAEGLADTLMAQANAEDRQLTRHCAQQRDGHSGLLGSAWARRDHDRVRSHRAHAGDVDRVVAA